jgi:cobalt-zinc-cadmium efflux system membrane fusion protein
MARDCWKLIASTLLLLASPGCVPDDELANVGAHEEVADFERGPHDGRWFADGDFAVELMMFEDGVPPEFRAFVFRDRKLVEPAGVELEVTLRRLGESVDRIAFAAHGGYVVGDMTVHEPHSYDAEIVAREGGREHRFQFSSYENRVTLTPDQIRSVGIGVAVAGPATISERVRVHGRIAPDEDTLAHVRARYPGVVRSVRKRLGDTVTPGDLLAVVESNESLQPYELRAQLAGTVIARNAAPGDFVSVDHELFEIADLRTVWVDLDVYRRDVGRLRVGQPVEVDALDGSPLATSKLDYISEIGEAATQTLLARVVLPNPDRLLRPGFFVTAEIEVDRSRVEVAVVPEALQRIGDRDVVFIAVDGTFEARRVEIGRRDTSHVEITSGLMDGQQYVAAGSFMLKAEAGKSGASHDH